MGEGLGAIPQVSANQNQGRDQIAKLSQVVQVSYNARSPVTPEFG